MNYEDNTNLQIYQCITLVLEKLFPHKFLKLQSNNIRFTKKLFDLMPQTA